MSKDEILKAGIAAAKSGNFVQATALFAQVVEIDPSSEQGWLGLGYCVSAPDQREYCFRRVLALNPNNRDAREQLVQLSKPNLVPPTRVKEPTSAESNAPKNRTESVTPPPAPVAIPNEEVEPVKQELLHSRTAQTSSEVTRQNQAARRKKKSNRWLIVTLILVSVPVLILCGLGIGYGFSYLNTHSALAANQPSLPTQSLTRLNTQTPTIPISTSSSTSNPSTPIPSPIPTVVYTPRYENTTCQFTAPTANVNCGYLIVPEDRTGDPSHTIKLAVAIYHSRSQSPEEPVVFLQGGPGAEAVKLSAEAYSILVTPFLSKRDFIAFDQRGTGLSEPALNCDELTKLYSQDVHGLIPASTRNLVYSSAVLSCNGLLQAQGINLKAYTTVESAADVRDLLTVLKYPKADLYGASYGTRLAQVVMRDYPNIVDSAILDSVVPVDTSLFSNYSNSIESGLKTLFTDCTIDPQCNAAYPNLETTFWDLVKQLDANPVTVTSSNYPSGTITQTVTGETVLNVILGSIKNPSILLLRHNPFPALRTATIQHWSLSSHRCPMSSTVLAPAYSLT